MSKTGQEATFVADKWFPTHTEGLTQATKPSPVRLKDGDNFDLSITPVRILDYLHRSFDGCAGAIVAPLDHGSDADRRLRVKPEIDIGVPTRVVENVVLGVKLEDYGHRTFDLIRHFNLHP